MPRKGTKGVSATLIPSPQQEEERKRVLKPENTRTKQPRASNPPSIRRGRQGRQQGAKNRNPREVQTKPKLSKEEIARVRSEAQKKRWAKMTPEQRRAAVSKMQEGRKRYQDSKRKEQPTQDPTQLQDECIEMVKYISQLKWEQQSYGGQGFIINWDSNDNYSQIESKVRTIETNVREMTYRQVSKFFDYCKLIADGFVYQYPEAMMKSNYHYDDMGMSNQAVSNAIENINKLHEYSFRCLQITDEMSEEDIQEEVTELNDQPTGYFDENESDPFGIDPYGDF